MKDNNFWSGPVDLNDDMQRCDEYDAARHLANNIASDFQENAGRVPRGIVSTQVKGTIWMVVEMNRAMRKELQQMKAEIVELKAGNIQPKIKRAAVTTCSKFVVPEGLWKNVDTDDEKLMAVLEAMNVPFSFCVGDNSIFIPTNPDDAKDTCGIVFSFNVNGDLDEISATILDDDDYVVCEVVFIAKKGET